MDYLARGSGKPPPKKISHIHNVARKYIKDSLGWSEVNNFVKICQNAEILKCHF